MKNFLGKKILVITAHPDDESYAAAGTTIENHKRGGQTILVCATLGERGKSHLKKPVSDAELKRIRRRELDRACKLLHIKRLFVLNLPDGNVRSFIGKFYRRTSAIANKYQPEAILGFGEDGISGHLDHVVAGRVAKRVAGRLGIPFFSFTLSPALHRTAMSWLKQRRKHGRYRKDVAFKRYTIKVKIDPKKKKRVLQAHASQMDSKKALTGFPDYAVQELLRAEYFAGQ